MNWFYFAYFLFIAFLLPYGQPVRKIIIFAIYSIIILAIIKIIQQRKTSSQSTEDNITFYVILLLLSFVVILITRSLPFFNFGEASLGYDTGFYLRRFSENNFSLLEQHPFFLALVLFKSIGIAPIWSINVFYVLIQLMIGGALFMLFRSFKTKNSFRFATVAVFLYAISATQFHAFWSMFPKQLFALALFIFSLALINKKSPWAIFFIILGAFMNTPTFAAFTLGFIFYGIFILGKKFFVRVYECNQMLLYSILGFSLILTYLLTKLEYILTQSDENYFVYIKGFLYYSQWIIFVPILIFVIQKLLRKKIITNKILVTISSILLVLIIFYRIQEYGAILTLIRYFTHYKGLATNFPAWRVMEIKGLFIDIYSYKFVNLLIIPMALFGFLYPKIWQLQHSKDKTNKNILTYIYIMFALLFILVSFPFIYQYRFVIIFDIFFILFAVPVLFILINYFLQEKSGKILAVLFFAIAFWGILNIANQRLPQLYPEELAQIKTLQTKAEPDAIVLATDSVYTPWVQGFSGRKAMGPGYGGNTWGLDNWIKFWTGEDDSIRYELLDRYSNPVYIFVGKKQPHNQKYNSFLTNNDSFESITPQIWKYNGQ